MSALVIGGYHAAWLGVALVFLVLGIYAGVCRQALAVFSRKVLLEGAPEERRKEIEGYLDREAEYSASLRALDLLLRLLLVLSLGFGRWTAKSAQWAGMSFGSAAVECLLLGLELVLVLVVFLEIVPGIAARLRPEVIVLRRLRVLDWVHRVFGPLRAVTSGLVRSVVKVLGGSAERPSADILEEEILTAAEEGERGGLLRSRDIDMIESIITYGDVEVSEVMTPRTEMVCLDLEDPLSVNVRRAVECGHSRIPVFRGSKDNIVGILYVKDLLKYWEGREAVSLGGIARKPHFVPLARKIGELFQEFKTQRFHIAIVLDEFGGTAGLVTIEDIIEEIVGEITDEHEKLDRPPIKRLGPGQAEVDGSLRIAEVNEQLGLEIPEGEAYDTIGGFLYSQMGRIPAVGDALEVGAERYEVVSADERRVRRLRIRYPVKEGPPGEPPEPAEAAAPEKAVPDPADARSRAGP
ncbi:MAG: HlyC/CorC family transporter [Planctomycetes bacterium]|nr:HlyC/CorC family transporter [Planctomycetota bacterium]